MSDTEFQSLEDGSSQDRSACPTCECAYLNSGGKLVWAECSETHRYICEYKGISYIDEIINFGYSGVLINRNFQL